jgi:hypothetical protein
LKISIYQLRRQAVFLQESSIAFCFTSHSNRASCTNAALAVYSSEYESLHSSVTSRTIPLKLGFAFKFLLSFSTV